MTAPSNEDLILHRIAQHYRDAEKGVENHYMDSRTNLSFNPNGEADRMVGMFGLDLPRFKRGELSVETARRPVDGKASKYGITDFEGYVVTVPYRGDRSLLDVFLLDANRDDRTTDVFYSVPQDEAFARIFFRYRLDVDGSPENLSAFKERMLVRMRTILERVAAYADHLEPAVGRHDDSLKEFTKSVVAKTQDREDAINRTAHDLGAMLRA